MQTSENLKCKILEIKKPADFTKSFVLQKPKNFNYEPGQHGYIELSLDNGKPFSFVSSPHENILEFATIIRNQSKWKQELDRKKVGDKLILSGPYGQFKYEDSENDIVFIAGGIGITPFMGILRYIAHKKLSTKVILLYSNKSENRTAFKNELDLISEKNQNIKIIYTMTEQEDFDGEKGRINQDFIREHVKNPEKKIWYVAGPPIMVKEINELLKKEFLIKKIKLDSFGGY
ncbi:FAD-dependent oxidoreductase [Candidatus Woesearchaeota archaeon]|nr:FAD-dependent oxidoreductase [Candidatus Woesearchaeota archaeon]